MKSFTTSAFIPFLLIVSAHASDDFHDRRNAVDYVQVCSAFGAAFYHIPGSNTCLRIGGRLRADYRYTWDEGGRKSHRWRLRNRAYVLMDARTTTEFGLLRLYSRLRFTVDQRSRVFENGQQNIIEFGFIQVGGLTAGRATSLFDFFVPGTFRDRFKLAMSDEESNLLAYTFGGQSLSASISLESAGRRLPGATFAMTTPPLLPSDTRNAYGGRDWPDLVTNIRSNREWGALQVMGVLRQNATSVHGTDSKVGWAAGAGMMVNLPMLGSKDKFGIQGTYSRGALRYAYVSATSAVADFHVPAIGSLQQSKAWSTVVGVTHWWSDYWTTDIAVSYLDVNHPTGSNLDFQQIDLQANLVWRPVSGLLLGADFSYERTQYSSTSDINGYEIIFRVQRDF